MGAVKKGCVAHLVHHEHFKVNQVVNVYNLKPLKGEEDFQSKRATASLLIKKTISA